MYARDYYREEMERCLQEAGGLLEAVVLAFSELSEHGFRNPPPWAVAEWLETYGYQACLSEIEALYGASIQY